MTATVSFTIDSPLGPRTTTAAYERKGAGEPLLLLHGIGHHLQAWHPVTDILAAEYDVIAVDLPGFGVSEPLPHGVPYDLGTVASALNALCAALGIERPHVAGNSLGGLLALEMGRVGLARSVTALSPAGFWSEGERRYAFTALRAMRAAPARCPAPPWNGSPAAPPDAPRSPAASTRARDGVRPAPWSPRPSPCARPPASSRPWPRAAPYGSPRICRACPSPSPGAVATGYSCAAKASARSTPSPAPASSVSPDAATCP